MSVARRENFGKLLEPGLHKIFNDTYQAVPQMLGELYNVQTTDQPYVEDVAIGAFGTFPKFTGTVSYDKPYQGYSTLVEFPEYADGFQVERKLFDDDRYNVINKRPVGLAIQAARRREHDAALLFNNADSTTAVDIEGNTVSIVGGDGKALCATDHPTKAPDGPTARSNKGVLTLNHANLQTTRNLVRAIKDDRGNQISTNFDTLLVPPALEEMGWELIQSEKKINTNENNPNIHQGKYKMIVWDSLTNDDNWFLIDSKYMKMFLNWYDRVALEFGAEEDFDTLVAKFRAYMRYNANFSDWIWIHGNFPA